ncbi:MAG: hypothetical protein ACFFDW_04965 [Candidatus Thorarchaeota archaeon]
MANIQEQNWFQKWSWKTAGWAMICFLAIAGINGLFSYLFDVLLFENKLGYVYTFFALIFFCTLLAFFYTWHQKNFFGIFSFGLCGLIGIPIEWWLEYSVSGVLKSPWGAVGWGGIYILYGLAADVSLILLNPQKNETMAILLTSLIFSGLFIVLSIIPLKLFYNPPADPLAKDIYSYWYLLIPYGLIQGVMGGYIGLQLGRVVRKRNQSKDEEIS